MIKSDTKNFVDAYLLYSSGSKFGQSHYTSFYMVSLMKVQTIVCMQPQYCMASLMIKFKQ